MIEPSPAPSRPLALPDGVRLFLGRPHVATIATTDRDGAPRQAAIWFRLDGDEILINSLVGRRWPANLLRDPRVSLAVTDPEHAIRWVGVRGTAAPIEDQATAQADIADLARRYETSDPGSADRLIRDRFSKQVRISFRVRISSIHDHL